MYRIRRHRCWSPGSVGCGPSFADSGAMGPAGRARTAATTSSLETEPAGSVREGRGGLICVSDQETPVLVTGVGRLWTFVRRLWCRGACGSSKDCSVHVIPRDRACGLGEGGRGGLVCVSDQETPVLVTGGRSVVDLRSQTLVPGGPARTAATTSSLETEPAGSVREDEVVWYVYRIRRHRCW